MGETRAGSCSPDDVGSRSEGIAAVQTIAIGVFFVVFLPQFVPEGWYLLLGIVAAGARTVLNRPRVRRTIDGLTGAVFTFFGACLALDA